MENLNLIRKIAWSYHKTTGIDVNDLIQEGCIAVLKAEKDFNPKIGNKSTYLWCVIDSSLRTFVQNEKQFKYITIEDAGLRFTPDPFYSIIEKMSREAMIIIDLLLSCPRPFITSSPETAKKRIKTVLKNKKIPETVIDEGIRDIQIALSEY